jgi:hypothetical protein
MEMLKVKTWEELEKGVNSMLEECNIVQIRTDGEYVLITDDIDVNSECGVLIFTSQLETNLRSEIGSHIRRNLVLKRDIIGLITMLIILESNI